jgi:hypothetical protein
MKNYYRDGVAAGQDAFTGPTAMRAKLDVVNAYFQGLNRDVLAAADSTVPARVEFGRQWATYFETWKSFFADSTETLLSSVPLISPLWWGSTLTRAESFERDLLAWKARFQALGGRTTAPSPVPQETVTSAIGGLLKWVAIAAAVGTVGYLITRVVK